MVDVCCNGDARQWNTNRMSYELKTVVEWDIADSRLSVESDTVGKLNKTAKNLVRNYKVDGALYIREGDISSVRWTDMTDQGNLRFSQVYFARDILTAGEPVCWTISNPPCGAMHTPCV